MSETYPQERPAWTCGLPAEVFVEATTTDGEGDTLHATVYACLAHEHYAERRVVAHAGLTFTAVPFADGRRSRRCGDACVLTARGEPVT